MPEKIRFRDNEKLLRWLSMAINIIILVAKIVIIILFIVGKNSLYEGAKDSSDEEGSIMLIGIFSFLFAVFFLGIIIVTIKSLFSLITIVVGAVSHFNKLYSALSIITAASLGMYSFTYLSSTIELSLKEFSLFRLIIAILFLVFSAFNFIVQYFLLQKNLKPQTTPKTNDEDVENINQIL